MAESSKQRWQPATAAATALSMTASTTSTVPSKTQRITAFISGSSSKNWRGKYLRALNISTPEVDVVSRKKHTPIGASGSTASTAALGTPAQRRMRGYRVDPNNRNSVTFSRSFSTSTEHEGDEFQTRMNRYQVSQAARYSNNSRRGGVIIKERRPTTTSTSSSSSGMGYDFAMKPDLARGRRCHTDPFVSGKDVDGKTTEKMASAPIQIPSAAANNMDFRSIGGKLSDIDGATVINKNYSSKRYGSKSPVSKNQSSKGSKSTNNQDVTTGGSNLLSWEEPAVMMGAVAMNGSKPIGDSELGGLDIAFSNVQIKSSSNSRSVHLNGVSGGIGGGDVFCDEFVDTDEDDRDENSESHGDDDSDSDSDNDDEIFEMEDFDSDNSLKINSSSSGDNNSKFHSNIENNTSSSKSKSRRRRTASASQVTAPPSSRRSSALPRYHSVRQMRANGTPSSPAMELPESFVPPHQMIQRDCFSIGLRDEFKRRQAKI